MLALSNITVTLSNVTASKHALYLRLFWWKMVIALFIVELYNYIYLTLIAAHYSKNSNLIFKDIKNRPSVMTELLSRFCLLGNSTNPVLSTR